MGPLKLLSVKKRDSTERTWTQTVHLWSPSGSSYKTHNTPTCSCHHANNLQEQYLSPLWHQELAVGKNCKADIKKQPAVLMKHEERSLTSNAKCAFIIRNYLLSFFPLEEHDAQSGFRVTRDIVSLVNCVFVFRQFLLGTGRKMRRVPY